MGQQILLACGGQSVFIIAVMYSWIKELSEFLSENAQLNYELQLKLFLSAISLLVVIFGRRIILWILFKKTNDVSKKYKFSRSATYIAVSIFIVGMIPLWLRNFVDILTFLGIVSAGLVIALQDIVKNMAGWMFIMIRQPFSVGDRIEIGSDQGDVVDIRLFQFTILEVGNWVEADQSTGRLIHIPNGLIFIKPLVNFYKAFAYIWNEVSVFVTFESDWEKAKSILQKIGDEQSDGKEQRAAQKILEAAHRYMIHYKKLTPMVYTIIKPRGVKLTLRFLSESRRMRICQNNVHEEVLRVFSRHEDIKFAYPTTRFYQSEI